VIFLGNGDGTFAPFSSTTVAKTGPMAVADFKGDGHLDLAMVDSYDNQLFILLQP